MKKYLYEDLFALEEKHWWHIAKRRAIKKIIRKYSHIKNPKILDIGCGAGKNMEELQELGNVYGLDSSPEALSLCRKRGLKKLTQGSAEMTHLKSASFNIITMLDVLEHTNDNLTLKEMQRILKKGGIIIITVPAFNWLWSKWDEVLHHKRRYTTYTLKQKLLANNFDPIKMTYLFSFLVIPALIIRTIKQIFFTKFYPSDFKLSNPALNLLLGSFAELEFFFAERFYIPFGTSVLVVAKKHV